MRRLDVLELPLGGTHLVEASAGTGKTWTIAMVALRLVLEQRMPIERILVVTYTRAATAELRLRIRQRLNQARRALETGDAGGDEPLAAVLARVPADVARPLLETAIADFDRAAVLTIHGFCQRVLHENAFESGAAYDTELAGDIGPLVRELTHDFWARRLVAAPPGVAAHAYVKLQLEGATGLTGLVHRLLAQPEVAVLPAGGVGLEAAVAAWEPARAGVAALYDRAQAAALFGKRGLVDDWLAELEDVLRPSSPPGIRGEYLPRHFDKLCGGGDAFAAACRALVAADEGLAGARAVLAAELVAYARDELGARKAERRVRSYDDLLVEVRDALESDGGLADRLRERFAAALIDEFQDTDPIQFRIFERAFHDAGLPLYLIGDPKQAIYGFRGGDVHTYLRARDLAGPGRQWTIAVNRRSGPRLVQAMNALYGTAPRPFVLPEIAYQPVDAAPDARDLWAGAPLRLLTVDSPDDIAERVATHVRQLLAAPPLLGDRPLGAGDIAILCRTNKQAAQVQDALRERKVPNVLGGDASVLDAAEAGELQRLLEAAADPSSRSAVRAAVTTPFFGETGDDLARAEEETDGWEVWRSVFQDWSTRWRTLGFMPAFRHAVESQGVPERLLSLVDGERRLTNLFHLAELLHAAERERHLGPDGLVHWLEEMRADAGARGDVAPEAMQMRLESDDAAVKLTTVHRAKGLEYPVVYCPYLCGDRLMKPGDGQWLRFHDDAGRATLDLRGKQSDRLEQAEYEASAEQARVLYVALTRAKHACFVVWHASGAAQSPLAMLLHGGAPAPGLPAAEAYAAVRRALEARLKDGDEVAADLREAVARGAGAIATEPLPARDATRLARTGAAAVELRAADKPDAPPVVRSASFSSLTASASAAKRPSVVVEEGVDVDATPGDTSGTTTGPLTLAELPPGARTGTLLHTVLEEVEFARDARAAQRPRVADVVKRFGYEERWVDPITRSLDDVLDTPVGPGFRLADVTPERRQSELEFWLPVAEPGHEAPVGALADAIREHGELRMQPYAAKVRTLRFEALAGYLRGFIDLVFEQDGKYWVVDYKSNRLGNQAADYRHDKLEQAMVSGHYVLQYLLYSVAVHRHLRQRVSRYDYRKFGGVLYLFVRGMSPERRDTGVFFDRPPQALIEALDRCLTGGRP